MTTIVMIMMITTTLGGRQLRRLDAGHRAGGVAALHARRSGRERERERERTQIYMCVYIYI